MRYLIDTNAVRLSPADKLTLQNIAAVSALIWADQPRSSGLWLAAASARA